MTASRTKPKKAAKPAPEAEPLTSPCNLSPDEALYVGKSMEKKGKALQDAAKKRGAEPRTGERVIDVELRLVDRPITSQPSAPGAPFTETVATLGMMDLLVAFIADECEADMTLIDAKVGALVARVKKVRGTKSGEALLANVAEVLPEKVDSEARKAGFVESRTTPGSPGGVVQVRCEPTLHVKKVRRPA